MNDIKYSKGINLIELLTALAVLGILLLVAVPLFTSLIQNYRISAVSDDLYNYLQFARTEAVKRNANVYVSFHTGDTWCYDINAGSNCDCTVANSCTLGTTSYTTAQQISLSTSGMASSFIYFEGSHGAANASGSVTFTQYGAASPLIQISIGRLGNVIMCSTGISGYTAC